MAQITLNSSGVASSGSLLLQTNGTTTQATLDTSGNLGLGITPSAWGSSFKALQVTNATSLWSATNGDVQLSNNVYYDTGYKFVYGSGSAYAAQYQQKDGKHIWQTAASGTAGNAITFTQAMTLDASGNLGVNVTSPQARLDVRGTSTTAFGARNGVLIYNTNASGNQSNTIGFGSAGSASAACYITTDNAADGTGTYLLTLGSAGSGTGGINFLTNNTERARIDSSGNLLVGTTSTTVGGGGAGTIGFRVDGSNGILQVAASSNVSSIFNRTSTTGDNVSLRYNGTQVGSISVTGSATVYNTSSDYRLKDVTGSLTGYKERLSALQPKQGSWKADGSYFRGFLAHEFAVSYPASVNGEKDAVDADGNPQYQGMQAGSSEVIADLVAYVKELETRLAALENK